MGRLTAIGTAVDRDLVPAFIAVPGYASTSCLLGEEALAAFVRLAPRGNPPETFELGVRLFGSRAGELADELAAHVRAWDDHGRPSAEHLRVRAYPRDDEIDPAATVIEKRHARIVVEWHDTR
jgi:protein-L-isoaspartate(D-aspartate) O-methyltransferase